ncbi:hypothetical protein L1D34_10955 [Vibrio mediterranei]|uniref:hypothetical protein n=1 Tax=Vibrio mediterranei TaxID=689 RepID=UPI001EFE123A|nr:hypothetical protein [Vibrio mediterranei]MCG9625362.1 hypothetical protein [Vibrio mediterranei]
MRNPDTLWVLPQLNVARTRTELLHLKKRHRAPFRRVFKHAEGYHFYHSDDPNALCIGEGVKQDLVMQLHRLSMMTHLSTFLYLEYLGDQQWYAVKLEASPDKKEAVVVKEWKASWSELDNALAFDWHQGTPIVTATETALRERFDQAIEPIIVSQPDIDEKACSLNKGISSRSTLTAIIALITLGVSIGVLWHLSTTAPKAPPAPPSAFELRMKTYQTEVKPSDALRTLSTILAYLPLLPDGLTPASLTLLPDDTALNIDLTKAPTLQSRLWEAFTQRHPDFARYAHVEPDVIHITVPVKPHTATQVYEISDFQTPLKQTLERMGYLIKESQREADPLTITQWQLRTDRFFDTLSVLTELTDSPALSLTHLEIDGNTLTQLTTSTRSAAQPASLTLTLQGIHRHEDKGTFNE